MEEIKKKWTKVSKTAAQTLLSTTGDSDNVFNFPLNDLPDSLQEMPGLETAYISSYVDPRKYGQIEALGEFELNRYQGDQGKGYTFLFGISGVDVYFWGLHKPKDGHYFNRADGVPLGKLFGKIPPPKK